MSRSPLRALTHNKSHWLRTEVRTEEISRSPLRAFVNSLNLEQEEF